MVAGGLPNPRPDHAQAVAEMALAVRDEVASRVDPSGRPLAVRIGMDTGPVVAGMIGTSKFSDDLWGDTVNMAGRMESHGVPGIYPGDGPHVPAAPRQLPVRATGTDLRQGEGRDRHVLPRGTEQMTRPSAAISPGERITPPPTVTRPAKRPVRTYLRLFAKQMSSNSHNRHPEPISKFTTKTVRYSATWPRSSLP